LLLAADETLFTVPRIKPVAPRRRREHLLDISA
jgi:hypothetical protein